MTVPELGFQSTDSLVHPSKFFPAEIHVPHHQLRNFISTAYDDKIYYVHNFDIFVLNLKKQQRVLVATVPFEARCLAARHGWICVGGETKGDCAFVRIGEDNYKPGQYGHDLIVEMLGKEIVNSMTIHRIPSKHAGQPEETVVLISNNDKTVTLYSLSQQEILCVLAHEDPMNYASMSPDCSMIAAVGDSNRVHFYRREDALNDNIKSKSPTAYQEYNWGEFAKPLVPAGEGVWDDFSFAVAFSPSGQYCAVSAQGGAISVFDMTRLRKCHRGTEPERAIICTFRSSRTNLWGCVRSLSFSPEPWDLLAWTEDHGTIGVADIRQGFVRRQCLSLDRGATETVEVENATPEEYREMDVKERLKHQYMQMQRMRALRGHPPLGARSLGDTHGQQPAETSLNQDTSDLDARERSVLEALESTMDDVEHHSLRPYSINYTSSPNVRPSTTSSDLRREYDVQLLNPGAQMSGSHAPRRRSSVVLSESTANRYLPQPELNRALMTASPAQMSEDNSTPPMSTNDLTPSGSSASQPLPYNIPPSDPWHVIEAHLAGTQPSDQPASLARIEAAIYAERQLSNRLESHLADERRLSGLLRTELEARERLLEAHQQQLESEQLAEARSPSIERILQRQLQSEQENNRRRSNEIESEITSNSRRVERLMAERESLLTRAMEVQTRAPESAISSALPTINTRSISGNELDRTLRQMEEERRIHRQRIQELELQVRGAESRVGTVSTQSPSEQARSGSERISDARFLAAARPGHSTASLRRAQQMDQYGVPYGIPYGSRSAVSTPPVYISRLRAAAAASRRTETVVSDIRSTIPRNSELAGRVSENDMRLARTMLHAAVMDANGNWISGHPVRRNVTQQTRAASVTNTVARTNAIEELTRDRGVGTAGIGWNADGSYL